LFAHPAHATFTLQIAWTLLDPAPRLNAAGAGDAHVEDQQTMLEPPFSLDDIMAPLGAERFFAEYEGKKPLHLQGAAEKFARVMTFAQLNRLLGQITIWSHTSLELVLDKEPVAATAYCAPAVGRDGGQVLRPDPDKVKAYLRRGATLVANDIDHLSPGLTDFARTLEEALGGKVQGNLYLSSKKRQGFAAHFDTHDVYAVHVEGTKTWQVYEGRLDDPIAHPRFKAMSREQHDKHRGGLMMEVRMKPGDLLYLPRGWYHDALADEGPAVHIAFGVTYPIGLDVLSMLFEHMVAEPRFRANLPRPVGAGARGTLELHLRELGRVIRGTLAEPRLLDQVTAFQRGFRYPRHAYNLPELLEEPVEEQFRVRAAGIRLVEHGGRFGLLQEGSRAAVEVPAEVSPMVAWVLERKTFSRAELAGAFPDRDAAAIDRLLRDLGGMRLAVRA
jgi:bifunctional lysine-specific demethylase and histidyl-hydroxylase MINA